VGEKQKKGAGGGGIARESRSLASVRADDHRDSRVTRVASRDFLAGIIPTDDPSPLKQPRACNFWHFLAGEIFVPLVDSRRSGARRARCFNQMKLRRSF